MKVYSLLILVVYLALYSCKKEEVIYEDLNEIEEVAIHAGETDTTFFTYTFINPMSVDVVYDSMNLYGHGSADIDFDFNGSSDLIFSIDVINPDSIHLLNGSIPNPYPNCSVLTSNNLSVVMQEESLMINGNLSTVFWCDTIQNGELIDENLNWSEVGTELNLWREIDGIPNGCWLNSNGIRYLGFKLNDKFGWLAIDATDVQHPMLIEFAIQR